MNFTKITLLHLGEGIFFLDFVSNDLCPLAEFLVDVFGAIDFSYTLDFVNNPKVISYSYDMSELNKEKKNIVISSLYATEKKIKLPKEKFIQLLNTLKNYAYLATRGSALKNIIFEFDDKWNCRITPQYEE